MPRPKSEITGTGTNMCVRLTPDQKDMFKVLGGAEWLRNYLNRQIRSEQIQLGIPTESKSTPWNKNVS
jgi:hypothetical protein